MRLSAGDVSDKEIPPADVMASPDVDDTDGGLAEVSDEAWSAGAPGEGALKPDDRAGREVGGNGDEEQQPQGSVGGGGEDDLTETGEAALREVERAALRIQPARTLHRSLPLSTVLAFLEGCASAQLPGDAADDAPAPPLARGASCHDVGAGP